MKANQTESIPWAFSCGPCSMTDATPFSHLEHPIRCGPLILTYSPSQPMPFLSVWTRLRVSSKVQYGGSRPGFTRSVAFHLLGLAAWVPVIAWFNLHVAELTFVKGGSMHPYLNDDGNSTLKRDLVLNWKWKGWDPSAEFDLEKGMVITFRSPLHPEKIAVKRVIGLEGEKIDTKPPYPTEEEDIPDCHLWVEGDGPPGSSLDSNTYGPISQRLVTGRVTHILFPFRKFGTVKWWEHKDPRWEAQEKSKSKEQEG